MENTPNYIELLNAEGSQPWQLTESDDTIIFSGYKFSKRLNCWLWCRVEGERAKLFKFGTHAYTDGIGMDACIWDKKAKVWRATEKLVRLGEREKVWAMSTCKRSMDRSIEQRAHIKTEQENLIGLDAVKRYQTWFKVLNSTSRRIQTARQLFPIENKNDLYRFDKKTNQIIGVKVKSTTLLQKYLIDMVTEKRPEFSDLKEWYLPSRGIFLKKRSRTRK